MSSCLSGGGRPYTRTLESLDLEVIKSPSSTSWISNSSNSPSSTLSESSNCPLAISTRKPRTPRKRPNQTYNEAAAILSTAHPKIFPFTKNNKNNHNIKNVNSFLFEPTSDLLMLHPPLLERPHFSVNEPKGFEKSCQSPGEINSNFSEICDGDDYFQENFDAESILDEEIGEGIDSIMGKNSSNIENNEYVNDSNPNSYNISSNTMNVDGYCCYGYPVGLGFEYGYGMMMRREKARAMRENYCDDDWWRFPIVNMLDLTPQINNNSYNAKNVANSMVVEKKKKKKKVAVVENKNLVAPAKQSKESFDEAVVEKNNGGLMLKLNYDGVLSEWSDKGSPFSGDAPVAEAAGNDVQTRLAQIDLFSENGGVREASVLRYKEKRRTRLFSKKIRYQVRKVNADRRPRMKGRFVRTPNSPEE